MGGERSGLDVAGEEVDVGVGVGMGIVGGGVGGGGNSGMVGVIRVNKTVYTADIAPD